MESSRMMRWGRTGARYGCIAAAVFAALGVVMGPRSIVLPVAGVAALPTFLPFLHWRAAYFAPLNEWVAILPCIVANWTLVGAAAGWIADRFRATRPAIDNDRLDSLERVLNDLGSDVAELQAKHDFDQQLGAPAAARTPTRSSPSES